MGCHKSKPKKHEKEPQTIEPSVSVTERKKDQTKEKDEDDKLHEEQKVEVQVVNMLESQKLKTSEIIRKKTEEEKVPISPNVDVQLNRQALAKKMLEEREAERLEKQKKEKKEKFESLKGLLKEYITKLFTIIGQNVKSEHNSCFPLVKQIRIVRKELNELKIDFLPGDEQTNYDNFVTGANDIIQKLDDIYNIYKQKKKDYPSARREILFLCREADTDLDGIRFADEDGEGDIESSPEKPIQEVQVEEVIKEVTVKKPVQPKSDPQKKKGAAKEVDVSSFEQFTAPKQPFEEFKTSVEPVPEFPEEKRDITEAERIADKELAYQMEKEKNDAIFEYENAVIKLRRLKEDHAQLKNVHSNFSQEMAQMRKELFEMKRQQHSVAFETDSLFMENNTYKLVKDKLVQENQRVKDSYLALKQELFDLQAHADVNIEQYHAEDKKLRIEQLESQINQRKLDCEELRDKYNNLKVRFQESNTELVEAKAALYRKAVELDLEAIQNGSKALPLSENPPTTHLLSQNQAPQSIIADSKIAASMSLIERAREARIEDPSMVHLDVNPQVKTVSYFNTDLNKNIQMRYSTASRFSEKNGLYDFGVDSARNLHHSPYGREIVMQPELIYANKPVY